MEEETLGHTLDWALKDDGFAFREKEWESLQTDERQELWRGDTQILVGSGTPLGHTGPLRSDVPNITLYRFPFS